MEIDRDYRGKKEAEEKVKTALDEIKSFQEQIKTNKNDFSVREKLRDYTHLKVVYNQDRRVWEHGPNRAEERIWATKRIDLGEEVHQRAKEVLQKYYGAIQEDLEGILSLPEEEFQQLSGEVCLDGELKFGSSPSGIYAKAMFGLGENQFKLFGRSHRHTQAYFSGDRSRDLTGEISSLCLHQGNLYDSGDYGVNNTLTDDKVVAGRCIAMRSQDNWLYLTHLNFYEEWVTNEDGNESKGCRHEYSWSRVDPETEKHEPITEGQKIEPQTRVIVEGELLKKVITRIRHKIKGRGHV